MPSKRDAQCKLKAKIFNALSDTVRLEIVEFLRGGEKCVCDIVPHIGLIQPSVSRHLKILKDCGLVKDRKEGNRRLYSITESGIFKIIDAATADLVDSLFKHIMAQVA
jgi:ArsR family transcriptional regulator